ncbi:unnamed protein product [Polarella glacialis]|uniref:Poly [ADP-ribose] polymerase n=1 Tax=Polarella glacialis TaxID=89957 RepID=A0A813J8Q1_POLGL|nr:unnamed protein product [Polarella glacialis]
MGCIGSSPAVASGVLNQQRHTAAAPAEWRAIVEDILVPLVQSDFTLSETDLEDFRQNFTEWSKILTAAGEEAWRCAEDSCVALGICSQVASKMLAAPELLKTEAGFAVASELAQILSMVSCRKSRRRHVKRVTGAAGWALHGLAFELMDGTRLGAFLENSGKHMDLLGDKGLQNRGGKWTDLQPFEQVLEVKGHHCKNGYLAYDVNLVTSTGRAIFFGSTHTDWRGGAFSYKAAPGSQIEQVHFKGGRCTGVSCVGRGLGVAEEEMIRVALQQHSEPVVRALAQASAHQGHQETKYAFRVAADVGLGHLDCFDGVRAKVFEAFNLPAFWDTTNMTGIEVLSNHAVRVLDASGKNFFSQLPLPSRDLQGMQAFFDASFRKRYTRDRMGAKVPDALELVKGSFIQNALNWANFCERREAIKSELARLKLGSEWWRPWATSGASVMDSVANLKTMGQLPQDARYQSDLDANDAWLFHGTNDEAAGQIIRGDFRIDKAGSNAGTLFGKGIYLAESCSKSDEYSGEDEEGLRCMLLCRATLGNVYYCDEPTPDPNMLVRSCVSGNYHSDLGDREKLHNTFREFVVYDDDQVYPEYLFYYRRVYK